MKLVELLKMNRGLLRFLADNDARMDDWQYVAIYERFMQMRSEGVKYSVAMDELAADYKISRATIERVIRRLQKDCG